MALVSDGELPSEVASEAASKQASKGYEALVNVKQSAIALCRCVCPKFYYSSK